MPPLVRFTSMNARWFIVVGLHYQRRDSWKVSPSSSTHSPSSRTETSSPSMQGSLFLSIIRQRRSAPHLDVRSYLHVKVSSLEKTEEIIIGDECFFVSSYQHCRLHWHWRRLSILFSVVSNRPCVQRYARLFLHVHSVGWSWMDASVERPMKVIVIQLNEKETLDPSDNEWNSYYLILRLLSIVSAQPFAAVR